MHPKDCLRIKLDDPSLPEPLSATLFLSEERKEAQLMGIWRRA
ncbi:DUF736 family protein [Telmatospirillum sp.]